MTKQKIKHYEPQTVTEAEKVLADLEGKRQKLLTFAQQLTEARRAHSYAAHVGEDAVLKRMRLMLPIKLKRRRFSKICFLRLSNWPPNAARHTRLGACGRRHCSK